MESKIYTINFEEYLRPKQAFKNNELQSFQKQKNYKNSTKSLKLLEARKKTSQKRNSSRWQSWLKYFKKAKNLENTLRKNNFLTRKCRWTLHLPDCLSFLHKPKNDDVCQKKTGFEIYCEMASIHGFKNFIDSRPSHRLFWALVIGVAVTLSLFVINKSFKMSNERPTVFYTESITDPTFDIPIPAITICNLNKIAQHEALTMADKFMPHSALARHEILRLFQFAFYASQELNATEDDLLAFEVLLKRNNYTIITLLKEISPKCSDNYLKLCKERGHYERCQHLFHEVYTPSGVCCSFNYFGDKRDKELTSPIYTQSSGYQTGVSILMNPNVDDYNLSIHKFAGYEVYLHGNYDVPTELTEKQFVNAHTETMISVTPLNTYATNYLYRKKIELRGCYFPDEFKLLSSTYYTLSNCLAECRSHLMYEKCGCIPPFWPALATDWKFCQTATEITCCLTNKDIFGLIGEESKKSICKKRQSHKFICDCRPLCGYNRYSSIVESTPLDRNFSLVDKRLFKGIHNIGNYTLLHVFYGDLIAERYRHDATENWVSTLGKIGGIAGLYMGYSIISSLELTFFIFIRPLCNWVTKQQIRFKKQRNQRKLNTKTKTEQQNGSK